MRIQHKHKQSGAGLVEVLVAVIVLSIGFLAGAKMQMAGMRNSQNAYFLSQANFMLRDMTDRMRANREGVLDGYYDGFKTTAGTLQQGCITNGTKCSIAEIASADMHAWSNYLHAPTGVAAENFKAVLPGHDTVMPEGEIALDATTGVYTVSVSWGEMINGTIETQRLEVFLTL